MMFCFVHIAMHNPEGKYVGFKILMLIFDKGFSLDMLVQEGDGGERRDQALGPDQRHGREGPHLEAAAAEQAAAHAADRRQPGGDRGDAVQAHLRQPGLPQVFGERGRPRPTGSTGRPYYANIARDTPPGCAIHAFAKAPTNEFGGQHPIGPTISHNHKRFVPPSAESPGVNVFTAGTLDARGKPIELHECSCRPAPLVRRDGNFDPPQHVKDNGWCHICHDPSVTNIMSAPLPHKMHGNVEPEDCLLRIFWKLTRTATRSSRRRCSAGSPRFEQNRDSVLALFHRMEDSHGPGAAAAAPAQCSRRRCSAPTASTRAPPRRRRSSAAPTARPAPSKGEKWVLSVRQPLRDISIEQEKVHAMVNDDDKQNARRDQPPTTTWRRAVRPTYDVEAQMRKRRAEHAEATRRRSSSGCSASSTPTAAPRRRAASRPATSTWRTGALGRSIKEAGEIAGARAARAASAASSTRTTRTRSSARPTSASRTASRSWRPTSRPLGTTAPS